MFITIIGFIGLNTNVNLVKCASMSNQNVK